MRLKNLFTSLAVLLCLGFFSHQAMSQQIGNYNFDNCDYTDANGTFPAATTAFDPTCDCGLDSDGMYFDGNDDNLVFPEIIDSLMEEDFTISFYFQIDQATTITDLLSVRGNCDLDSFMAVTYNPADATLNFQIAQSIGDIQAQTMDLDPNACWNRLVITKSDLFYQVYLNDQLEVSFLSNGVVNFAKNARLAIANSPCIVVNEERFNGWIDEFQFITRAYSAVEVTSSSLHPDQITTNDTTIVEGSEVMINVGANCVSSFTWNPITDLDDPSVLNPVATPSESTVYQLNITNPNGCQTTDEVTINVITEDAVNCENLLLPNAFTPNNDQLNDRFGISNIFLVQSIEYFEIYDRWGAKMWEGNNVNDTWDGSFKGNMVNAGMYMYKVKYTCGGNEYVKVDNFSVLR